MSPPAVEGDQHGSAVYAQDGRQQRSKSSNNVHRSHIRNSDPRSRLRNVSKAINMVMMAILHKVP
ncbi:uncharacterized protein BDV14DRAFT_175807 [Aspergillus stella-maris]|uniref:uncharacterized protein n=1 Tax=Aspergillus stella-maris TaxID=1810926 RepID=UPI003CCCC9C6